MSKSLFFCKDKDPKIGTFYGVKPYASKYWADYYSLNKKISLKNDLEWKEVKDLQRIISSADTWREFPAIGLTLVNAEFKGGDENQRIDLLYLRNDGAILPCELKIGGDSKDTHGQLIRYMSDLAFQELNMEYLQRQREHFLSKYKNPLNIELHENKFSEFVAANNINNKSIRLLPRAGIIIDEGFPDQLLKAVRFLNNYCGFSIRMLRADAWVSESWSKESEDYLMRLDFTDIQ